LGGKLGHRWVVLSKGEVGKKKRKSRIKRIQGKELVAERWGPRPAPKQQKGEKGNWKTGVEKTSKQRGGGRGVKNR